MDNPHLRKAKVVGWDEFIVPSSGEIISVPQMKWSNAMTVEELVNRFDDLVSALQRIADVLEGWDRQGVPTATPDRRSLG